MSASDHLGRQFDLFNLPPKEFENKSIHRGIHGTEIVQPLGMHWSAEHGIPTANKHLEHQIGAVRFVGDQGFDNSLDVGQKGTIIHALPERKGIKWGKKGDKEFLRQEGVFSAYTKSMKKDPYGNYDPERDYKEAEVPVRPGSKVLVTGITRVRATDKGWKTRKRNFKPPREMKA